MQLAQFWARVIKSLNLTLPPENTVGRDIIANKIRNSKFATPRHTLFFFIYITGAVLLTFEKTIIISLIDANFPNSAFADILIILTYNFDGYVRRLCSSCSH